MIVPNPEANLLDEQSLAVAAHAIAKKDPHLAKILANHGSPPLWAREPGFVTLLRIILEQQVSLASADAMFRKLHGHIGPLTPESVLDAGEFNLRSLGVTRQKSSYMINVARAVLDGELDFADVESSPDHAALEKLTAVKGIGPWTAGIYLLMALRRPDVWPVGDIALATAYQNIRGIPQRPGQRELEEIAQAWRPYRATAARLLWHYYLCEISNRKKAT